MTASAQVDPASVQPQKASGTESPPPVSMFAPQKSSEPELSAADRAKKAEQELQDYRNHRAGKLLQEAQEFYKQNANDPWTYQSRLKEIAGSYGSAPAALEARKLLDELKSLPPPPDRLELYVPEAKEYQLVYDLDLAKLGKTITYGVDNSAQITKPFDRVAYFIELQPGNAETKYLYVSMDAFTNDVKKIGVPTTASGARFQQNVSRMNVVSNVKGITQGTALTTGNIEFWNSNYGPQNGKKVPNASDGTFDFGDAASGGEGYGSMQVHNYEARQTLFAINHWSQGGGADIGIGNQPQNNPDWTFSSSAGQWRMKRLRVLVRCR